MKRTVLNPQVSVYRRLFVLAGMMMTDATFMLAGGSLQFHGAIYKSTFSGTTVNANLYGSKDDIYLNGGAQNLNAAGLPDGIYYFQITDPNGSNLLSTDDASCRQLQVIGGNVAGASPAAGSCAHPNGAYNTANDSTSV